MRTPITVNTEFSGFKATVKFFRSEADSVGDVLHILFTDAGRRHDLEDRVG